MEEGIFLCDCAAGSEAAGQRSGELLKVCQRAERVSCTLIQHQANISHAEMSEVFRASFKIYTEEMETISS